MAKTILILLMLFGIGAHTHLHAQTADLILHHGKIVQVDKEFNIAEAIAVDEGKILAVGSNEDVLKYATDATLNVNLQGKMVLPGLIDSHVHATDAAVYEFDHSVPDVATLDDVLKYIASRAETLEDGQWIRVQQMFITRLEERRFPTRAELDQVAPDNPVIFRTGPDIAVNSLALKLSGIDDEFELPESSSGLLERDSHGKLTGIIRGETGIIKFTESQRSPKFAEQRDALKRLIHDYNSVGITSISDRNVSDASIDLYKSLLDASELNTRVYLFYGINPDDDVSQPRQRIESLSKHPLHNYNNQLWLRGIKVFLDGGMLTGSAYMREPWGVSQIYSITDPTYRGTLKINPERLYQISKMALTNELQMTAHAVGDGAVHNLIDAYRTVIEETKVIDARPCITHCNFMSKEAIELMKTFGIVADLQPAWLYLDGPTLLAQFGEDRLAYFQPYRALFDANVIVGGGSDHMQKIGSFRSVNPYNPFLGMSVAITRKPRKPTTPIHPEHCLSREEAIRLYTINNAYLSFEEKVKGSLEVGKLADMIVLDRDILTCPESEIAATQVLTTYLGGKTVFAKDVNALSLMLEDKRAKSTTVNFHVELKTPLGTNQDLYLTGGHPKLGNWRPNAIKAKRVDDLHYRCSVDFSPGEPLEFKFTLGSWQTVEKDSSNRDIANRKLIVDGQSNLQTVAIVIERFGIGERKESTVTGDLRLHSSMNSAYLPKTRNVSVWLPPQYESTKDHFSVIYLQDGQNLFDGSTSAFGAEWQVDETLTKLIQDQQIEPIIVVGVWNTPDRVEEYTASPDPQMKRGGNGSQYVKFITQELKPFIDREYRTKPDQANAGIGGSSLGGLISLQVLREASGTFGKCMCMSPTLGWNDEEAIRWLEQVDITWLSDAKLWIDMGTKEGSSERVQFANQARIDRVAGLLKNLGLVHGKDYQAKKYQDALHNEQAWAARFGEAMQFLFGTSAR